MNIRTRLLLRGWPVRTLGTSVDDGWWSDIYPSFSDMLLSRTRRLMYRNFGDTGITPRRLESSFFRKRQLDYCKR